MPVTYNKNSIIKFFLFGFALFALTLSYVVIKDIKDVLIVTSSDRTSLLLQLKQYSFYVKLIFFGLFLLVYRRNKLPKVLFANVTSLLTLFIIFHFWGFQRGDEWVHFCYYLLADVWGAFTITLLFWAFANQTFTIKEAKLSYPLLTIFPSLSMVVSGAFVRSIAESEGSLENIMRSSGFVLLSGLILFILSAWLIKKNKFTELTPLTEEPLQTRKMSSLFKWIYLFLIFVIITSFGFCEHLTSFLFKSQLKDLVTDPLGYSKFMGQYSIYMGCGSGFIFLLTFWVIWKFGWLKSALILPLYALSATCFLLLYVRFPAVQSLVHSLLTKDEAPLLLLLSVQLILFKSFAMLFVSTKEIAYIPLGLTTKVRGKAAVDFLFGGVGAWLLVPTFFSFSPINQNIESSLLTIIGTTLIWLVSVLYLGKMFRSISRQ